MEMTYMLVTGETKVRPGAFPSSSTEYDIIRLYIHKTVLYNTVPIYLTGIDQLVHMHTRTLNRRCGLFTAQNRGHLSIDATSKQLFRIRQTGRTEDG